jgi:Xaa-Pro aminopeptidase
MPVDTRRQALAAALAAAQPDLPALLVTKPVNVRYVTGFTGSNGAVLVPRDGDAVLATDGRYATQAAGEVGDGVEVVVARSLGAELVERAAQGGLRRVGVERHHLTLAAYDALAKAADRAGVELIDGGSAVEAIRERKDDDEIAALAAACQITDEVFAAVLGELRPGLTETDVAWRLRVLMHDRDAEPAFDSIVAFGENSARPHHQPTDRALRAGDLVKLDFGAKVAGYHADMTRTVVAGRAQAWQREVHDVVRRIQAEARARTVPGAVPVDLDTAARSAIEAAGYDVAHGLGHGVGLEIHESPFLVPGSTADRLVDRVPVTVEPGVYLPGRGGVRVEDTVLVREGGPEALTTSPRELIEI